MLQNRGGEIRLVHLHKAAGPRPTHGTQSDPVVHLRLVEWPLVCLLLKKKREKERKREREVVVMKREWKRKKKEKKKKSSVVRSKKKKNPTVFTRHRRR